MPPEAKKVLSPPPPHSIQKTELFACFRFLIFHPFFQGGQLTPFASMCGRPLPCRCGILLHILHVPWSVHMSGMSVMCEYAIAAFFAYFSKVRISHKVAFSTAILTLFVFLLPISIRLRYLDHLVANRMAPSIYPDRCGTRCGSWFQAILYHISAHFRRIFGVYAVRIF